MIDGIMEPTGYVQQMGFTLIWVTGAGAGHPHTGSYSLVGHFIQL